MFAVLHVSDFSLQAVLQLEHELALQPVALIDETRRTPIVMACTKAASAAGFLDSAANAAGLADMAANAAGLAFIAAVV